MNIRCLFGHNWRMDSVSSSTENTCIRKCVRCGKRQRKEYDMSYGEPFWRTLK